MLDWTAIIVSLITSPILIVIVKQLSNINKRKDTVGDRLDKYIIFSAELDLRRKCWDILDEHPQSIYTDREFYILYNNLINVKSFDEWDDLLKKDYLDADKKLKEIKKNAK